MQNILTRDFFVRSAFIFVFGAAYYVNIGPSLSVSGRVQSASSLNQMRGVSYPPPSPRGITRAQPVPQSRNPPLVKTRRLTSVGMTSNFNVNMAGDLGTHHQQHSELAASINPTNMDLAGIPQLSHSNDDESVLYLVCVVLLCVSLSISLLH